MMDEITTRDAFGIALERAGKKFGNLIAIGADTTKSMGFTRFMEKYPERSLNIGIAEQNMALAAAGAAACGAKVVIATYATFASMRICEMVRTFICYPKLDVKIIAGLGGLAGDIEGVTHQGIEDIGVLRSIADLVIVVPADATATEVIAEKLLDYTGPAYIRIGRGSVEKVFDEDYDFEIGKANVIKSHGKAAALFCNGVAVARTIKAADILEEKGISCRVIEMPCVKPIDKESVIAAANECGLIVTVEEHNVIGGLGSAVCEVVCSECPTKVVRIGIDDMYTESAPHGDLLDKYNLAPLHISEEVMANL